MSNFAVKFATYGALSGGNENQTQAVNVAVQLQKALDANDGIVNISNATLGPDPSKGNKKHFGALVTVNGADHYFACEEGQTIDFYHSIPPTN
ncbi:MAG: hypothetical protein A3D31_06065 [Candidatus Fluviicola riflensis]|nr:MAG: hypothetical protein CHH17_08950 [Candidatus Fluviicola riflensis]OGS79528.1 MAG: hypothetical protein A3D31_06065 [Candidatus Fluviicola riflensis]OGS86959.1 MAG: hypothetical protein A2724_05525 [Fluviicola sp. RIFCSPHIGHO2_01_FULL_43_53]OGS89750.1 MAG: hypothetical protein A3E30_02270 [Fluviicola sp. RIFCSPHIGHO2_12_FULL_43_24]